MGGGAEDARPRVLVRVETVFSGSKVPGHREAERRIRLSGHTRVLDLCIVSVDGVATFKSSLIADLFLLEWLGRLTLRFFIDEALAADWRFRNRLDGAVRRGLPLNLQITGELICCRTLLYTAVGAMGLLSAHNLYK